MCFMYFGPIVDKVLFGAYVLILASFTPAEFSWDARVLLYRHGVGRGHKATGALHDGFPLPD